jgi:hypothetical protein
LLELEKHVSLRLPFHDLMERNWAMDDREMLNVDYDLVAENKNTKFYFIVERTK